MSDEMVKMFEGDMVETFTDKEMEQLSEYIDEVHSQYSVTRNRDGSVFSSSQMIGMKQKFPKGANLETILNYQRIQATNYMQKTYSNKRLKQPNKE